MATYLRSFMEAIAPNWEIPGQEGRAPESRPWTASTGGGPRPREPRTDPAVGVGSRAALECRGITGDPDDVQTESDYEVEELGSDSEEDVWEQRNPLDSGDLASQIVVRRPAPVLTPHHVDQTGTKDSESPQSWGRRNLWVDWKLVTCWRMLNFIKMLLLSCNRPMRIWNVGILNRHVLLKRLLEHFMLQSLRHPRDSRSCWTCKSTMKLTSNWLLAEQFLSKGAAHCSQMKPAGKGSWTQTNGP